MVLSVVGPVAEDINKVAEVAIRDEVDLNPDRLQCWSPKPIASLAEVPADWRDAIPWNAVHTCREIVEEKK